MGLFKFIDETIDEVLGAFVDEYICNRCGKTFSDEDVAAFHVKRNH